MPQKIYKTGETFSNTVEFNNCEFSSLIYIDCNFEKKLVFKNVDLGEGTYFKDCIFKQGVSFADCTTHEEINELIKSDVRPSVTFENCRIDVILDIKGGINGDNVIPILFKRGILINKTSIDIINVERLACVHNGFTIEDSVISGSIVMRDVKIPAIGFSLRDSSVQRHVRFESVDAASYSFINTKFEKNVHLWGATLTNSLTFNNGSYLDEFKITAIKCKSLTIYGGDFRKKVLIDEFDAHQENVKGGAEDIWIENSKFSEKLRITGGRDTLRQIVKKIKIISTKELVGDIAFNGLSVFDEISLEGLNYDANIQFNNIDTRKLSLRMFSNYASVVFQNFNANNSDDSELYIQASNLGNTSFLNCDLNSFKKVSIENSVFMNIISTNVEWFNPNKLKSQIESKDFVSWKQQREIFRQLKFCMEGNQDRPQALRFKSYEMNAYRKSLKMSWRTWDDVALLNLNRLSNKHGLSWFRGVVFTIILWQLCYSAFVMLKDGIAFPWEPDSVYLLGEQNYWNGAFQYLWLPNGLDELSALFQKDTTTISLICGAFFFLIGKIAIAYGIYQTISAFRKYGKS